MGNRATIVIKQDANFFLGVYLHWAPGNLEGLVQKAVQRASYSGRINDKSYGIRIMVSEIIGDNWNQDLSFGLTMGSSWTDVISGDNENTVYEVDLVNHEVNQYSISGYDRETYERIYTHTRTISIAGFVADHEWLLVEN